MKIVGKIGHVQIFNRWGGLVWESTKVGEVWPGSVFNGNYHVADGVYVYRVVGVGWNPSNTFHSHRTYNNF